MIEPILGPLPKGWSYTTLGKACDRGGGGVQTGPFGSQLHASDYVDEGIPSIMPANIGDNRIVEEGIARITEEDAVRLEKYRVRSGDIVYSRRGDIERRALVRAHEDGWLCGTGCLRVRVGPNGHDPIFTAYYLGHPKVRQWIVRHALGATMANLNTTILSSLPFIEVPSDIQRAIAKILGDLDDKTDLLRETNRTLEDIARSVFRAWFVDFAPVRAKADGATSFLGMPQDIFEALPSSFEPSEIGEIPKGWTTEPLIEQADWINGASYKNMHFSEKPDALPVVKIAELKKGISANTQFTNTDLGDKYRITTGDLMFSWSGSPETSIDAFIWALGNAWLNQHIFVVRRNGKKTLGYLFALLKHLKPTLIEIAKNKQTTGLGHVTREDMARLQVCEPSEPLLIWISTFAQGIYDRILTNLLEIETLASLRDTLLPKLISGELEAPSLDALGLKAVSDGG